MFQFFYVLTFILLGEIVIGCGVFVIYIVPEARENFLRSQPEQILRSAVQKYMDDPDIKSWLDGIQSEVSRGVVFAVFTLCCLVYVLCVYLCGISQKKMDLLRDFFLNNCSSSHFKEM